MAEPNGSLNGSLKSPKGMNGHTNGTKPTINGKAVTPTRRRTTVRHPGFVARSFSLVARLVTWYSILTVLFRCPSTIEECNESSPRICQPYFRLKQAITPHVEPYYDTYAAPYVELARPYYETIDQKVLSPTLAYAAKYGAPRVAQAQAYSQAQWEQNVQPQLAKYESLARDKYQQSLAPHVDMLSSTVSPYYDIARTNALQTYHELILPSYQFIEPYALQGYLVASAFTTDTAIPSAAWALNKTYVFLDGTVWPQLRVVYSENVEPQLVKISQRLGRYNGNTTQKAIVEPLSSTASKAASSFTKPASSTSSSSLPASSAAGTTSTADVSSEPEPPSSEEPPATTSSARLHHSAEPVPGPVVDDDEPKGEIRRIARDTVAEDLKAWQEKYAKAADEGAAEIEERVDEISKRMIRRQAKTMGRSVVDQLQKSVSTELATLRTNIKDIVGTVNKGSLTAEDAREQIGSAVRRAGVEIKEKAQEVRLWHENYDSELQVSITKAAESHFRILESIRDLALQKIGMKWAWMDGVTYKDWAKFHLLKDRFEEWQGDLEKLIVTHPGLEAAQNAGQQVEDEAMDLAQSAAKELARLKDVANWKLAARDDTDEFDSDVTRQAAEAAVAEEAIVVDETAPEAGSDGQEGLDSSVLPDSEQLVEVQASTETSDVTSILTEEVPTSSVASIVSQASSLASDGSETIASVVQEASSFVLNEAESETLSNNVASTTNAEASATETAQDIPENLALESSSILLTETPIVAGNTSEFTEPDGPGPAHLPVDEVGETVDGELSDLPPPSATPDVKSVFLGAAAQSVPSRVPVLDDDAFDAAGSVIQSLQSEVPSTISSVASSAYSAALSRAAEQYSHALSAVSVQVKGTPEPAHKQLLASASSVYSQALETASSRYYDALQFASQGIFPTSTVKYFPTPTGLDWERVESIAAERLNLGRAWAEEQYENARIAVGLATPTPTDISGTLSSVASVAGESAASITAAAGENVERLLEKARYNYYAGLGVAHARYSEFISAASSAVSSLTASPTPTDLAGTASSAASVASESASSVASVISENASSAVSVAGDSAASAASIVSDTLSSAAAAGYEGVSAGYESVASAAGAAGSTVQESWDSVLSQISVQVYGAPTPTAWYESIYSAAGEYSASATSVVGDGASAVTSVAGTYAAAASEEAAKQYAAVSSIISELVVGKEPTFSESVYSRLNAAYSTAVASASSVASAASASAASVADNVASAASDATEAVKETIQHAKDEL